MNSETWQTALSSSSLAQIFPPNLHNDVMNLPYCACALGNYVCALSNWAERIQFYAGFFETGEMAGNCWLLLDLFVVNQHLQDTSYYWPRTSLNWCVVFSSFWPLLKKVLYIRRKILKREHVQDDTELAGKLVSCQGFSFKLLTYRLFLNFSLPSLSFSPLFCYLLLRIKVRKWL